MHNRIRLYIVGGFVCQEQEANYVDMLLLTWLLYFYHTLTPAAVKALDKSFILQISAKTKARKSCHFEVLNSYKRKLRKNILLTPSSPPLPVSLPPFLSVSPDSCHSLHTIDQDYYEGTDYLSPVPADGERTEDFEYEVGIVIDINA